MPNDLTSENVSKYRLVIDFINGQYKDMQGRTLIVSDSPKEILKAVRHVTFELPSIYKLPLEQIEEYNRKTKEIFIAV